MPIFLFCTCKVEISFFSLLYGHIFFLARIRRNIFFNLKFPGDNFCFAFDRPPPPSHLFSNGPSLMYIDFTVAYLNNTRKLGVSKIGSFL